MEKSEKNEKNFMLRSFFGLVPRPEGQFRGQVPYPEILKSLGLRGGPKKAKKRCRNELSLKKMKRNEKNSKLRSFFELVPRPEGELRGQAPYPEVLKFLGYRGGGAKNG